MSVWMARNLHLRAIFQLRSREVRSLIPFLLVSMLLHGLLFWVFISFPSTARLIPQPALHVTLLLAQPPKVLAPAPRVIQRQRADLPKALSRHIDEAISAQSEVQDWAESAHQIAREEALQTERKIEMDAKSKLNTPLGQLEEVLRHPHKETRLANGMVKWEGAMGAVCFNESPPYFAWDMPNLFKIARTCP